MVQMERSVHWRGASPAPVRRTLWVTAATCVPQDTTTSQNALRVPVRHPLGDPQTTTVMWRLGSVRANLTLLARSATSVPMAITITQHAPCVTVTLRERLRRSVTRQQASVCVRRTSCSLAVTAVHLVTITTPRVKSVNVLSRAPLRRCVVRMVSVHVNQTLEGVPVAGVIQASTATQTVLPVTVTGTDHTERPVNS